MIRKNDLNFKRAKIRGFVRYTHKSPTGTKINGNIVKFGKVISFKNLGLIRECLEYGLICEFKDLPKEPIVVIKCQSGPRVVDIELLKETSNAVQAPEVVVVEEEEELVFKANEAECIKSKKDLVAYCKERGVTIKSRSNISLAKMLEKAIELAAK